MPTRVRYIRYITIIRYCHQCNDSSCCDADSLHPLHPLHRRTAMPTRAARASSSRRYVAWYQGESEGEGEGERGWRGRRVGRGGGRGGMAESRCISLHLAASRCISLRLAASHCISLRLAASHCILLHLAASAPATDYASLPLPCAGRRQLLETGELPAGRLRPRLQPVRDLSQPEPPPPAARTARRDSRARVRLSCGRLRLRAADRA